MNKEVLKILSYIIIALLFLIIGILIGKNFNYKSNEQHEPVLKTEKITVSTFIVSKNDNAKTSNSSNDIIINDDLINTYREVINSKVVQSKVKEKYPNVKDIELEQVKNTGILKAIYVCENYTESECIDINNMYISTFANNIANIYNVNISVIDSAEISTRIVEE